MRPLSDSVSVTSLTDVLYDVSRLSETDSLTVSDYWLSVSTIASLNEWMTIVLRSIAPLLYEYNTVVTSARSIMVSLFLCLFVCLSVCLSELTRLLKTLWVKVKVCQLYSASSESLHFWSAQHGSHSFLHCKYTMPPLPRSSPGGATTEWTVIGPADEA